ncbi:MAG: DUF4271 domain-containing protein, partial [Bacteroidales bacterium]|nr:DUF4271 domain-containing protein [Bacteroidales bacterium]
MSGQEPLNSVRDTISPSVFAISGLADDVTPIEGGLQLAEKALVIPPTWLFVFLFLLLGVFAWVRLNYGNILMQTIQASTSFQVAARMFKDNSLLQKQLDNVLYAFYFLSVAFLLYLGENRLQFEPYGLAGGVLYLFNLALLAGVFFGRIIVVNLSGFLFNSIRIFREYLYNTFIFNKLLGIVLLPILLLMVYTTGIIQEVFHWVALATVSLVLLMRLIRGVIFSS